MLQRFIALAFAALLAACADPPAPATASEDLTVTIRVQNAALDFTKTFVHRGDERHKCVQAAQTGYSVVFGPDASTVEQGGSTVPMGSVVPGLPPLANPVVNYFRLQIEPQPNQPPAGPAKLSRSFSLGMTARGGVGGPIYRRRVEDLRICHTRSRRA